MSFSNQTIKAPVQGKPHICKRQGYWRVSPLRRPYSKNQWWSEAHALIRELNQGIYNDTGTTGPLGH